MPVTRQENVHAGDLKRLGGPTSVDNKRVRHAFADVGIEDVERMVYQANTEDRRSVGGGPEAAEFLKCVSGAADWKDRPWQMGIDQAGRGEATREVAEVPARALRPHRIDGYYLCA